MEFEERYDFVLHWLQRRHAHVAASVLRLGRARLTDRVPTAAIVARGTEVWLYFNPDFCDAIDNHELAGVLTHEALHFFLAHQERTARIDAQVDRFYFGLACEAVVNDLLRATFPEVKLPGDPITGMKLVGRDTSRLSADYVMQLLKTQRGINPAALDAKLACMQPLDDHSLWRSEADDPASATLSERGSGGLTSTISSSLPAGEWTEETTFLIDGLLTELSQNDPSYGTLAFGVSRLASPDRTYRKNLARFLNDTVSCQTAYDTVWTVPNRKLVSVYPNLILPSFPSKPRWNVLIAIDASGSVPDRFVSIAIAFARKRVPSVRQTVISFDTVWYECDPNANVIKGGGGTRAQAVEEFIQQRLGNYPDSVFVLTDGFTPKPSPRHPGRWIWLLPPWGSTKALPNGSRAEFFEAPVATRARTNITEGDTRKGGPVDRPDA